MYDGGWYEWLMHDDYPVQVGDPASDECENFCENIIQRLGALSLDISDSVW